MTLPPLPKAERIEAVQFCDDAYWFSAEQMREYGHLVRAQALEALEYAYEQLPLIHAGEIDDTLESIKERLK